MRTLGALLPALLIALASPSLAESPEVCKSAEALLEPAVPLQQVSRAVTAKSLTVLILGAGSSTLPGTDGPAKAYPARLQVALSEKLPGVAVKVVADVKFRRTAIDMLPALGQSLVTARPNLVVWQTGTVDSMRSVDIDQFKSALEQGVANARSANADVIFINSQYSPRTESIIALGNYIENLRWVALQQDVLLFDRYNVMKLWAELGTFDFLTPTKKLDTAEQVHNCIAQLLAVLIIEASKMAAQPEGAR